MSIHVALFGEPIFNFLGLEVTNTLLLSVITAVLLIVLFAWGMKKREMIPGKVQNFFEMILEAIFSLFDSMTGSRQRTEEIFPLTATLFLFILFCNLIEIIPGLGVFSVLRSPSSDLHFTLALAVFAMGYLHIKAMKKLGGREYMKKYIKFDSPIMFFVGILEGIGEFTRTFSLGVRLFGNLFAGEILLMIISMMVPLVLPLPFLGLELFVAFIQALVFSSLIAVFYAFTATHEEH
ncbi:MAG: F0F1 ATP synthase subunit A [Candidatus Pacebacteria bacterium]|nr:F0F1 ATP synthase subunit A [Candidatus Paceibacterota bacterium]